MASWTFLPERGVVEVAGPDARHFLHNLVSTDIEKVGPGRAAYGALLSPQGKIQFDFVVHHGGERYVLELPRDRAPDLAIRLGFYKLRAAVAIGDRSDALAVLVAWGDKAETGALQGAAADPRLPGLGIRTIVPLGFAPPATEGWSAATAEDYDRHRLALALPEGGRDFAYGEAYPHEADLDQLGGVDFRKGCYTGQEVVSRMEHRATARRRIVIARSEGGSLPSAGTPVTAGAQELGNLGTSHQGQGLAMIRLDRAARAQEEGTPILAAGVPVALAIPPWARFVWPVPGSVPAP